MINSTIVQLACLGNFNDFKSDIVQVDDSRYAVSGVFVVVELGGLLYRDIYILYLCLPYPCVYGRYPRPTKLQYMPSLTYQRDDHICDHIRRSVLSCTNRVAMRWSTKLYNDTLLQFQRVVIKSTFVYFCVSSGISCLLPRPTTVL